ncbi:HNH endonuclease [Prevotella lacticifex]|nr:HNH endonuclease [Prevotella lacticifex]
MTDNKKSSTKRAKYNNFGELLYYAYANLQMLCYALGSNTPKYDKKCYMIRAKAYKAYKEGRWNIHDLMQLNVAKIKENNFCWYCGKEMPPSKLTIDHVFPRNKGGNNDMDNIIMVCKTCNSSKGNMDLFEWYSKVQKHWPPLNILIHYMKNIYQYSKENGLMDKHAEEMDLLELPFNWRFIPIHYPQPEEIFPECFSKTTEPTQK